MNVRHETFSMGCNSTPIIFSSKARRTSRLLDKAIDKVNFANDFCTFLCRLNIKIQSVSIETFNCVVSENQAESLVDCKIIGKAFKEFKHSLTQDLTPKIIHDLSSEALSTDFSKVFCKGDDFEFEQLNLLYRKFVNSIYKPHEISPMEESRLHSEEFGQKRKRVAETSANSTLAKARDSKRARGREIEVQDEENEVEEEEKEKEAEESEQNQLNPIDPSKLAVVASTKINRAIGKIISKKGDVIFNGVQSLTLNHWESTKELSSDNPSSVSLTQTEFKKIEDFDVSPKYAAVILNTLRPLIYINPNNSLSLEKWKLVKHNLDYLTGITKVKVFQVGGEDNLALGFRDGNLIVYDLKNLTKRISFDKRACSVYYPGGIIKMQDNVFPLGDFPIYCIDALDKLVAASSGSKASAVTDLQSGSVSIFRGYKTTVKTNALFDKKLFTSSKKEVLIWDLTSMREIYQLEFPLKYQEILTIIPEMYGYFRVLTKSKTLEYFDTRIKGDTSSFGVCVGESNISAVSKDSNNYYIGTENGNVVKISF